MPCNRLGDIMPTKESYMGDFAEHPDDKKRGFLRMMLRYGPEDLLRAQGHIPSKPRECSSAQAISC